jgi:molybdopterin-biosynthesis enzyme MoeA-like protein
MSYGFHVSLYQIRQGYVYFHGEPLPDNVPYVEAADAQIRDYGRERVRAVLAAIGPRMDDIAAQAAAKAADPGA